MTNSLEAKNLVKSYKGKVVVDDISINVKRGEIVGLLGPNGAGKTTTFSIILGLIPQNSGQVFLENEDITELPMYVRARKGIGLLPQEPSIFQKLSVEDNL
ncbi:MAG: ATP-binding cassette domain-containing protein, partial [Candidatus Aminicenantaceae bacterium]